jgi:hypothetical protein
MSKVGIIVDKRHPIKKISGPVKSSILIPKKQIIESEEGLAGFVFHLPLFLNFGDIHLSKDLDCDIIGGCDAPDCYKISDSKFLKKIDKLGETYNIDLYLEYFEPIGEFKYQSSHDYISEITNNNIDCFYKRKGQDVIKYGKNLSKTYKLDCPTNNIKWHFADVRKIVYNNSGKIIAKYLKKPYFLSSILSSLVDIFRNDHDVDLNSLKKYFKSVSDLLLDLSQSNIKVYYNDILPRFKKILEIIFIQQDTNINNYLNEIVLGQSFKEYSIIHKQLTKQNTENYELWMSWLQDFIKYHFTNMRCYRDVNEGKLLVDLFMEALVLSPKPDIFYYYFASTVKKLLFYIVHSQAILLDIYFLLRVFKIISPRDKPDLVISYFGYKHTNNIEYFLTNIMEFYDKITIQEVKPVFPPRCIYINEKYDLREILEENRKFNKILKK